MNAVTLSLLVLYNNNGATKHELVLLDFIPQLPQHRPLWDRSNAETIKQAIIHISSVCLLHVAAPARHSFHIS